MPQSGFSFYVIASIPYTIRSQKMKEMIEYAIKMLSKGDCEADVHHLYWNKICTPNWITVLLTEEGNSEIFLPHPPHPPYHMTNSKSDIPPDMAPSLQNQAMSSEEFPKWPTTATQTNDDTTAQSNLQSAHLTGRDHEQASHILNKQYATPAQENRPSAAYVQPQPQVNPATATFSPVEHFVSQFHESSVPASPTSIPHESFQAQPAHQHRAPASVVPQEFLPPALQHY